MKKRLIPLLVTIILMIVISGVGVGSLLWKKYSYSDTMMDLREYYQLEESDQAAIVHQNEHLTIKAKMNQGTCYLEFSSVQDLLNDRFYHDTAEHLLLYTTPLSIITHEIGSEEYYVDEEKKESGYQLSFYEDEQLYVALPFVQEYTAFTYRVDHNPYRIHLMTTWEEEEYAELTKNSEIRYRGGVKSDILRTVKKGEKVTVIEHLDRWTKVKTEDAFIGYVPSRVLDNFVTETVVPDQLYEEPEYTSLVRDHKINLGWHQVMSEAANETLTSVVKDNSNLNVISPTWFSLKDNQGGIRSIASVSYVNRAHQMGMEVWGLVDNFDHDVSSYTVLTATSSRRNLIHHLMNEARRVGLDGINVDFEDLSYDSGEGFIQFIRELSIACRKEGLVLSVDNYVPRESTAHYHRKEQGVVADYVIIMGYDEHWGGGGVAGSVASLGFVKDGIDQTISQVPAKKVINALPFYTRVWKTTGDKVTSEALDMETAWNFIKNNNINMEWDEQAGQNYGEIKKNNTYYQIWMEDAQSIRAKLEVMESYQIGGTAAWKLGFETPDIWDEITNYMKK